MFKLMPQNAQSENKGVFKNITFTLTKQDSNNKLGSWTS